MAKGIGFGRCFIIRAAGIPQAVSIPQAASIPQAVNILKVVSIPLVVNSQRTFRSQLGLQTCFRHYNRGRRHNQELRRARVQPYLKWFLWK